LLPSGFAVTPVELVVFRKCLSSRVCVRVFQILQEREGLNLSAVSRRARCSNRDGLRHLRNLARLGIVHEEFYAGRYTFTLKRGDNTELMKQTIEIMEGDA